MRKVYHKIIQIAGNVITVEADNVGYNDLAEVTSARGTSLAQVIRLQDDKVFLQVFTGSRDACFRLRNSVGQNIHRSGSSP